ncbi:hypothetical protein CW354_21795 [Marinicaulis flavus]|uniref:Uncharacterized protein n=1 Tax=Hyphococcus luteus TaxID=2058213 RepID=A0A2S7JZ89_9PROT|nr:hypothetical protein CW354_21795 [Marinicaulis flavus]
MFHGGFWRSFFVCAPRKCRAPGAHYAPAGKAGDGISYIKFHPRFRVRAYPGRFAGKAGTAENRSDDRLARPAAVYGPSRLKRGEAGPPGGTVGRVEAAGANPPMAHQPRGGTALRR